MTVPPLGGEPGKGPEHINTQPPRKKSDSTTLNVTVAIAIVQDARSEPHGQVEGGDLVAPPREVHEQLVAPGAPPCEEALDLVRVRVRVQARGR